MKKNIITLSLLIVGLLLSQIQTAHALQKTYDWNIAADSGYNTYQISIITPDSWLVDTQEEITFRLTLTSKQSVLDHTETSWIRISLSTENFIADSGTQSETVTLRNIGDYWEKKVNFNISPEKVSRGQTLNASITVVVDINEFDNIQHKSWEHTGQNYDNPMFISISRPLLSTLELIIIIVVAMVIVGGIGGFLIYRRSRKTVKSPSSTTQ
jgi:hypothetical protein